MLEKLVFYSYGSTPCSYTVSRRLGSAITSIPATSPIFSTTGLKQGIMYRDTIEYQKAIQTANKYIRKHYRSHQVARRLHYKLKEEKYIEYDDDVLNLEIIRYNDGDIGLRIWDNSMEEILYEENIVNKTITKTEIKPAYPFEHVYQHNEETYLYKPGGIY